MRAQVMVPVCLDRPGSAKNVACRISVLTHVCSGDWWGLPGLSSIALSCHGMQRRAESDSSNFSEILGLELISCWGQWPVDQPECGLGL